MIYATVQNNYFKVIIEETEAGAKYTVQMYTITSGMDISFILQVKLKMENMSLCAP